MIYSGKNNLSVFLSKEVIQRKRNQCVIAKAKICGILFSPWSAIVGLLFARGPSAIRRGVISVIINTINAFAFGRQIHILKKVFKFIPSLTNFNSATSIVLKSFIKGIVTSIKHGTPNFIYFCFRHSMGFASSTRQFAIQTATRMGISCINISHTCVIALAAITQKSAMRNCANPLRFKTNQTPETFSNPFNFPRHKSMIRTKFLFVNSEGGMYYAF